MGSNPTRGDFLRFFSFIYYTFYVFILSFALEHYFNFSSIVSICFSLSFYHLSNCMKWHNNKFQSSSLDESSARLMTSFSTSLSHRLSLRPRPVFSLDFLHMLANGPPSFGDGLESIFGNLLNVCKLKRDVIGRNMVLQLCPNHFNWVRVVSAVPCVRLLW